MSPTVGTVPTVSRVRDTGTLATQSLHTVPIENPVASPVVNKELNGDDPCVKIMCQPTDVTKVVLYLREQSSSTIASQTGTAVPAVKADYLTPDPEYSTLKPARSQSPDSRQYSRMLEQKFGEFLSALAYGSLEHRDSTIHKKNVANYSDLMRNFKDVPFDDSEDNDYSKASVSSSNRVSYDEPDYCTP